MNTPVNRPLCVSLTDLDDAIQASVDRARQTNEMTKHDLNDLNGGIAAAIPGRMPIKGLDLDFS